jgi:hypothetical protein
MTKAQYTILGLLAAAAGLHIWLDPAARGSLKQFLSITPDNWREIGSAQISTYMFWFIALAAILLLSDYLPTVAIWIAVLILTGAILINNQPLTNFVNTALTTIRPPTQNKPS